jgi:hypothetical protein
MKQSAIAAFGEAARTQWTNACNSSFASLWVGQAPSPVPFGRLARTIPAQRFESSPAVLRPAQSENCRGWVAGSLKGNYSVGPLWLHPSGASSHPR